MKRLTSTAIRGQQMIEVTACDRFIADRVYIPEERRGLYMNESEALRFANGQIIKDQEIQRDSPWQDLLAINEKLKHLEKRFQEQFKIRADPEQAK